MENLQQLQDLLSPFINLRKKEPEKRNGTETQIAAIPSKPKRFSLDDSTRRRSQSKQDDRTIRSTPHVMRQRKPFAIDNELNDHGEITPIIMDCIDSQNVRRRRHSDSITIGHFASSITSTPPSPTDCQCSKSSPKITKSTKSVKFAKSTKFSKLKAPQPNKTRSAIALIRSVLSLLQDMVPQFQAMYTMNTSSALHEKGKAHHHHGHDHDDEEKEYDYHLNMDPIRRFLEEKNRTFTDVLNAIHHLKYEHDAVSNDKRFYKIFDALKSCADAHPCSVNDCLFLQYQFERLSNDGGLGHSDLTHLSDAVFIDALCSAHSFFLHSPEMDRLTKEERKCIDDIDGANSDQKTSCFEEQKLKILQGKKSKLKYDLTRSRNTKMSHKDCEPPLLEKCRSNEKEDSRHIYEEGVRFRYWKQHGRNHRYYIKARYSTLKEEVFENGENYPKINTKDLWDKLVQKTSMLMKTQRVKMMVSKGQKFKIYRIAKGSPFDMEHLMALLIHTDCGDIDRAFCVFLRDGNGFKVRGIANWARLLFETVQCFGTTLSGKKKYFRGVNKEYLFRTIVTRFNLPMSTSSSINCARGFAGDDGLLITLNHYKPKYNVMKLYCAPFSCFAEERETLFYGVETVLRIQKIQQSVNGEWISYGKYLEPINALYRMMHGLPQKEQVISRSKKSQEMMHRIISSALGHGEGIEFPEYIKCLMQFHKNSTESVDLRYDEMLNGYEWIKDILRKEQEDESAERVLNIPNIYRICMALTNSNSITIIMPNQYNMSERFNVSLREDLRMIYQIRSKQGWQRRASFKIVFWREKVGCIEVNFDGVKSTLDVRKSPSAVEIEYVDNQSTMERSPWSMSCASLSCTSLTSS